MNFRLNLFLKRNVGVSVKAWLGYTSTYGVSNWLNKFWDCCISLINSILIGRIFSIIYCCFTINFSIPAMSVKMRWALRVDIVLSMHFRSNRRDCFCVWIWRVGRRNHHRRHWCCDNSGGWERPQRCIFSQSRGRLYISGSCCCVNFWSDIFRKRKFSFHLFGRYFLKIKVDEKVDVKHVEFWWKMDEREDEYERRTG